MCSTCSVFIFLFNFYNLCFIFKWYHRTIVRRQVAVVFEGYSVTSSRSKNTYQLTSPPYSNVGPPWHWNHVSYGGTSGLFTVIPPYSPEIQVVACHSHFLLIHGISQAMSQKCHHTIYQGLFSEPPLKSYNFSL